MSQETINWLYNINQWFWIVADVVTVVIGIGSLIYKIREDDDDFWKLIFYIPVIAALSFLAWHSRQLVIVPDLYGVPYGEAGDILVHNDLRYEKMDVQNGEYVVWQEIAAGNVVKKHTVIKLELGEKGGQRLDGSNTSVSVPLDEPDSGESATEQESAATPIPTATPVPTATPEPSPTSEPIPEPISIRKVSEFYSDGIEHRKYSVTDNVGNTYEGYSCMSSGDFLVDFDGNAVYRNEGQYKRLYGRVIIREELKDEKECGWVKIYGDDTLLFDSGMMGRGVLPADFDIDISSYAEIKIEFDGGYYSTKIDKYCECYLVDTYFSAQ